MTDFQPTTVNELSVASVQDATSSRVSFRVDSTGTGYFDGDLDARSGRFFSSVTKNTKATPAAGDLGDGEFIVNVQDDGGASGSDATLTFKSGNTVYEWGGADNITT